MSTTTAASPVQTKVDPETGLTVLNFALPKGRMHEGVLSLLKDAGISVRVSDRGYRPTLSYPAVETKILKPQNVIEMLAAGTRDVGFAGADWIQELGVEDQVVELLDTNLDPVRVVLAAPESLVGEEGVLPDDLSQHVPTGRLRIATEYMQVTKNWVDTTGRDCELIRSFGATEVFPPEDADAIVDNTATGSTLRANKMVIIDDLMQSSTRLYASKAAWEDENKRERLQDLKLLIQSVLDARQRVMVTLNAPKAGLEAIMDILPSMREPTVAELAHDEGYSLQSAVLRKELATLIPRLKAQGATDLIVSPIGQIIP